MTETMPRTMTAETAIRKLRAFAAARSEIRAEKTTAVDWYAHANAADRYTEEEGPVTVRSAR